MFIFYLQNFYYEIIIPFIKKKQKQKSNNKKYNNINYYQITT